ncbi:MAG TPA: ABC transporter substrate-binding protein [Pyrinomonadaceae bacterium]|nr:ABC transporter substrate-binding protein [Pyrinomonadaceae bacterium]
MNLRKLTFTLILISLIIALLPGCRNRQSGAFVIAISDKILTLDALSAQTVDAGSERLRQMLFNSLVRKNEKFEYVGELASNIDTSQDGLTVTFTLRDGVTFHDGKPLTAADAKYTLDTLLASSSAKATSFYEGTGNARQPFITSVDAPDARTLVIHLRRPWIQLFVNLVPINIIPSGSIATQKDKPIGSGPFKFKSFDATQQVVELEANPNYWEGAPQIQNIRLRVITDASPLQAELMSGTVQLAPNATNLTPDIFPSLAQNANLKVEQFAGANVVYIGFNVTKPPVSDARVRQAICYAIDRETIIHDLLLGQAKLAHSILPEESWAYSAGTKYNYDPEKAKQLLDQAGFRDPDGDGPKMRFKEPLVLKISTSAATRQYAGVIQDYLKRVGIPLEIESLENATITDQQIKGEYQMMSRVSVGGNQDPIFLRDLFATSGIPTAERTGFNRTRYSNPELDPILEEAANAADKEKAKALYARAQEIIARDVPMFPLWYPNIMVVAARNVSNIKMKGDGDWSFTRNLTIEK